MKLPTTFFETSMVAITPAGTVVIALFDGSRERRGGKGPACVVMLECRKPSAIALRQALGSVDKPGSK